MIFDAAGGTMMAMTIETKPAVPASPDTAGGFDRPHRLHRRTLASWSADRRWRTLLVGLIILAGAVLLLSGGMRDTEDTDQLVGDSRLAEKTRMAADFGERPTENVVVSGWRGRLAPAELAALTTELRTAYSALAGVAEVGDPALSADGGTLMLPVALAADTDDDSAVGEAVKPMLAATERLAAGHPELKLGQVGEGSISLQVGDKLDQDFQRAELISLPVTLVVLLLAFGAVVAAGVPLLLAVGAVATALGLTALVSREVVPVDPNTQSMVLLIGLAVGVDYVLFVLRRSREERAKGASVKEAIGRAGATAGRAVVISGITVVVAMSGMLVAGGMFTSLAIGAMLVVAVAVIASATVLPAILSILGDRVEKLRLPLIGRRAQRPARADGWWGRLAGRVTRRPLIWTVAAGGVLLALAVPALGMRTALPGVESLPQDLPVVAAFERLSTAFPQEGSTIDVVVSADPADRAAVRTALVDSFPAARAKAGIAGTEPEVVTSVDGKVSVLKLASEYEQSDARLNGAVDAVRADVVPQITAALSAVPGAQVHVGGDADATDLTRWLDGRLPWVVGFVLVLTFVVMLVSFGSIWLAGATVLLNLLSVGAAYGVMTLIFQNTWAEGLLGFTSIGSIAAWLPLLMFVILFGLSMDYHVFVVSRVREAWHAGVGPAEAVQLGIARSAGVVTSAAAVMVAVFAIFATLSTLEMKQLGVGLATAVLLDATLVRGVLLPAVLTLLGRRAHTGPRWVPALHD
jgi:RND superfamily putative drug exporter